MKTIWLVLIFITLIGLNSNYGQNKGYKKFILDDIEYQTNGIDTICVIDHLPEFPGGESKLIEFLSNNINYPRKARKAKIEGKVILSFVVDKSGEIRNIMIKKSVSEDLDNEAIRVVKMMPKWKPAEQKGKQISFLFNLPINFKL